MWLSLALSCVFESLSRVAPRVLRWGVIASHGNVTERRGSGSRGAGVVLRLSVIKSRHFAVASQRRSAHGD